MAKQASVFDARYKLLVWKYANSNICLYELRDRRSRNSYVGVFSNEGVNAIKSLCDEIAQLQTVVKNQKALLKKRSRKEKK